MANNKLNLRLEKVKVMRLNVGEPKIIQTGKNQGKNYWRIGIRSPEGWMNMTVFGEDDMNKCRQLEDQTIHLSVWEEEWKEKSFTNCSFPSKIEIIELRVQELETITKRQSKFIRFYCEKNPEVVEQLKQFE